MAYGNGTNAPFGLQPRYTLGGANWNGQTSPYIITSGYATSIYNGDPVSFSSNPSTGSIVIGTAGGGAGASLALGIFIGVRYTDTNGNLQYSKYWPASTAALANTFIVADIVDDPNIIMDVQSNANPGATQAMMNQNANFVIAAGSTISGLSGTALNISTHANTATLDLKMIRFVPISGNTTGVAYNNVLCAWNTNAYKSVGTAGAIT